MDRHGEGRELWFHFFFCKFFFISQFFLFESRQQKKGTKEEEKEGNARSCNTKEWRRFSFVFVCFVFFFGFVWFFYRVFFFTEFFFRFHRFPARCLSSHLRDYRVLPSFTEFYRVLRSCSNRASPSYSELSFRWLLASFTGFYRVFPFELYWDLADWVLMTLT